MAFLVRFFLVLHLILQHKSCAEDLLPVIIDELNERLEMEANIVYNPQLDELNYLLEIKPMSQLIISSPNSSALNAMELIQFLDEKSLFVLLVETPPIELFEQLHYLFQKADFLLVLKEYPVTDIWLDFVQQAWELGYYRLLFLHTGRQGALYKKQMFPQLELKPTSVSNYVATRARFTDMHGFEIRVAVYSNPPRCLYYEDEWGEPVYGGYYMRFVRHFLATHNAKFVPVHTPNDSPGHCVKALLARRVDLCADALAQGSDKTFVVTNAIRMAYANIMVANAKPLSSYRYLVAPFHTTVWICLIVYIGFIVCFMSCIHWQQQRRWIFSTFLLEAISSLLFTGFALKDLHGRERYILFGVLFIAGFIYSTFYLGYLKSILTTEVFEEQINSFEQLLEANISIIIDEYDSNLTTRYFLPDMLWPIIQVVPEEKLKRHRTGFDQQYAYILFSDRMDLYDYAQKYLKHPRMRRIPINIFFLYAGFPMRESWFLKQHLSEAWANAFESGLVQKLALDADHETMTSSVGFLHFLATEYYEAQSLGLDYFVMPAMSLAFGYGLAFLAFVIELTAWRMRRERIH
ncbi:uncharacterized protein LOC115758173 [Drosophila novamexicana]|uniref:uncharacterized protein LOC115758173 n=1 Tax=Drosophila novamexicana TaxID=47314 RepID=UPI0011E58B68|nr:uncharacterized protein LOC115758173 [Drosophila novamexicana]